MFLSLASLLVVGAKVCCQLTGPLAHHLAQTQGGHPLRGRGRRRLRRVAGERGERVRTRGECHPQAGVEWACARRGAERTGGQHGRRAHGVGGPATRGAQREVGRRGVELREQGGRQVVGRRDARRRVSLAAVRVHVRARLERGESAPLVADQLLLLLLATEWVLLAVVRWREILCLLLVFLRLVVLLGGGGLVPVGRAARLAGAALAGGRGARPH